MTEPTDALDGLVFDPETGLIPAIVQDAASGRVLMLGYMNHESLARTRETGSVTFFSRRRQSLWTKGETSGNWLETVEIRPDCDGDTLLVLAIPHGPTCHTGSISCFGESETITPGIVLDDLARVIEDRKRERPEASYTAELFDAGTSVIARKVAEEALEIALEAATGGARVSDEAADLLYHLIVLLSAHELALEDAARVLRQRHRSR